MIDMDIIQEAKARITELEALELVCGSESNVKNYRIMVDLISRLVDRLEWKPIGENTPKDESILVRYGEPFFGTFTQGIEKAYFDTESGEWRFSLSDRKISTNGVTHWLPLPPAGEKR